ncbi:locomotion-related protein Hikaru genki-like isoform X2 [Dermacentor albipictus]|uniref:locomotion-related protein Hikaru genki-like isoform X2 n=1 Tax=Dermacentor albipictus TaxID=60249 RepID=UPI0038FCACF5
MDHRDTERKNNAWEALRKQCVLATEQCTVPDYADSKVLKHWLIQHRWFQRKVDPGTIVRDGNYLKVECETGYHFRDESLRGKSQIELYCNGGQWSPTAPWCTKIHPYEAPRDCEFPERANRFHAHNAHVRILVGNRVPHGTQLRFHCEPVGEVLLQGSPISRCRDGQWTPEVPYCFGRESQFWNGISMRFLTESYTVPGGVVYLQPNSDVVLDCWSSVPVEIRLNTIEKAYIERTRSGRTYIVRAKFRLGNGEQTVVRCEKSYERTSFRSIPVRGHHLYRCPEIPSAPNRVWKKESKGRAVQFDCENGYIRQGKSTVHCLGQGLWSDPFPTCELPTETSSARSMASKEADTARQMESAPAVPAPNGCQVEEFYTLAPPGLAIVTNDGASMVPSNSTFWAFCNDDGYTLVGNSSAVTCLQVGSWFIPPQMKCIETCADFETGPNGPKVEGRKDAYEFGDSITLSCARGTRLQPHVERIICFGRRWSEPELPICVPLW